MFAFDSISQGSFISTSLASGEKSLYELLNRKVWQVHSVHEGNDKSQKTIFAVSATSTDEIEAVINSNNRILVLKYNGNLLSVKDSYWKPISDEDGERILDSYTESFNRNLAIFE